MSAITTSKYISRKLLVLLMSPPADSVFSFAVKFFEFNLSYVMANFEIDRLCANTPANKTWKPCRQSAFGIWELKTIPGKKISVIYLK